jgi:hypothetical protein
MLLAEPPVTAKIETVMGCPRLFINNEIRYPLLAWSWELPKYTPGFKKAGIDLINPYYQLSDAWTGPGQYDWSRFDDFLYSILAKNPEALFLPRILLPAPEWWKQQHPDELVAYAHPPEEVEYKHPIHGEGGIIAGWGSPVQASFASEKWRRNTGNALAALLEHVEHSLLNRRIFGYQIGNGTTLGEWHYFGSHYLPDNSGPMQERVGYCPDADERLNTSFGLLRDPQQEKRVIDYYQRFHNVCAETIIYFCRIVKAVERDLVCGVFYDYQLENIWMQEGGHLAPEKILDSPHIDFIAGPYTYQLTNVEGSRYWENDVLDGAGNLLGRARGVAGDGGYRPLLESIRRHGKLHIVEIDPSTYLEKKAFHNGGSGSQSKDGTMKILSRDLGKMFVTGSGGWMTDHGPRHTTGWYDAAPIIDHIRGFNELGLLRKDLDLTPVSRIAAVYDAKTAFATQHWKNADWFTGSKFFDTITYAFLNSQARAFHRIGAPVDFIYRFDLTPEDFSRYDLIFMVNNFYLNDSEVDALSCRLKESDATVVWFYAPGFIGEERFEAERMSALTGFDYERHDNPRSFIIYSLIDGTEVERGFGMQRDLFPRFTVLDSDVEVLGRWEDTGGAAFVRKRMNGWTSVYAGTAPLPVNILRWLADGAGVPLWSSEPDIVFAGRDCAVVVATSPGERTLQFPHALAQHGNSGGMKKRHVMDMTFGQVDMFIKKS